MKQYGIRVTLPGDDPFNSPHLLGDEWASYHWYDTPEERDRALGEMRTQLPNYRPTDTASQVLDKVEREAR